MRDQALSPNGDQPDPAAEIARLKKIITVLMDRAERSTSAHGSEFNLFQTTIMLEQKVRNRTGKLEGLLRENEKMKRELLEATQRFERAFEHAPIGMALVSLDGRWLKVNRAMCAITGYSEQEMLTMSFRDITHPDDLEMSVEGLRGLQFGEIYDVEKRYVHADGHVIWVHLACSMIYDEHDAPLHIVAQTQDITEPKKLHERLHHAQRLESVGALAGGVAHDFNNLLAVIVNYVGLVRDELPPESQALQDVDAIGHAAERGARLTDELLAFAQCKAVEADVLDVSEVIAGMRALLDRPLRGEIELRSEPGDGLWPVEASRADLEQIILNLVVNARDAVGTTGRVMVSAENVELTDDRTPELDVAAGRYVRISVADDGCGIDADTLAHVWEPFFTTKGPGQGNGLGLASVYGSAHQMGGGVAIKSAPGRGTQVDVYIPIRERLVPPGYGPRPEAATGSADVLLVDAEPALRSSLRGILARAGFTVMVAGSGEQALEMLARPGGNCQLLLTGTIMQGMWGEELAARARELVPDLPVLFMSGHGDRTLRRDFTLPHTQVLTKPFSEELLLSDVAKLIARPPAQRARTMPE